MESGYKTKLNILGNTFDVKAFSYEFEKDVNDKGEVISPINGGVIYLSISELPSTSMIKWAISDRSFIDGSIQVIDNYDGSIITNEEVEFENAACISLKLIYERNNINYFTTLISISPQDICLGRSNCWINKEWTFKPLSMKSTLDIKKSKLIDILDLQDASIDCSLLVNGFKYEVQYFETEFKQPEDFKGEPQHEVKGGLLLITINQKTDEFLNRWMFQRNLSHSGTITFAPKFRVSNIPLSISFTGGKCVSFNKICGINIGLQLTLLISAEEILLNGIPHTNKYK